MKKILFLLLIPLFLFAKQFTVASYNIENLFDLNANKTDYKEYLPNTKSNWNKKTFEIKMKNSIKVLKDLDTDIIALQEIENKQVLKLLQKRIPEYKYISFKKYSNSSVGLGFLSKIKIIDEKALNIKFSDKTFRPILETTFLFDNIEFKIFNNHWPSKRVAESYRVKYAKYLFDRVSTLPKDYDYILLGDFNSNYNEYETIYSEKRLNNTSGITGINHVLNTFENKNFISKFDILKNKKVLHFNPWIELNITERFSSKFRGRNVTPDNILLPYSMFDNKKISYIQNSFKVFNPHYLYKNKKVLRWQMKNKVHLGKGFSDHLPIIATFSTQKQEKIKQQNISNIADLYKIEKLNKNVILEDCLVLYKNDNIAIIKQIDNRAIFIYQNVQNLQEGFSYDLNIKEIKTYKGLKEITSFEIERKKEKRKNYKDFYLTVSKNDFLDINKQNEIITNIKATYKKGYLYFDSKKISIYFKNKNQIPKDGSTIIIKRGHLGYYINKTQIVIYNKSDIEYVN